MATKCGNEPQPPAIIQPPQYDTRRCNGGGVFGWTAPISCATQEANNKALREQYERDLQANRALVDAYVKQKQAYDQCVAGEVATGVRNPDGSEKGLVSDNSLVYIAIGAVALLLVIYLVIRVFNR